MSKDTWIENPAIGAVDPGYIYIIENKSRYKIGHTTNPQLRRRNAQTWLPDMYWVGSKPFWNVRAKERNLHEGFAHCWYQGEWFDMLDDGYRDVLIEGFTAFSDRDINRNSIDFIYWFNGEGMAEFVIERYRQGLTLPKFLREVSAMKRNR